MKIDAFRRSLSEAAPPPLEPLLEALWWAGKALASAKKDDWNRAHDGLQDIETPDGSWVHAHLHRQEGDLDNARYWYGRAAREPSDAPLDAEWQQIADFLLSGARRDAQGGRKKS